MASQAEDLSGEISGTAVNGTTGGDPLAGAEVVLRASHDGSFVPVAQTTTDSQGRFSFAELPADESVIYLPGINRAGVHYPGPRVRLLPGGAASRVKLVAYETVAAPSPLINRKHELAVQSAEGSLEVTETLVIENPSQTTFIGQTQDNRPPVTLRLSLPGGIEKVTFDREFNARNFQLQDGQLVTDLPWPPGSRELKFIYRLPVERRFSVLTRVLDQPTDHVVVHVSAQESGSVACNLPQSSSQSGSGTVFEHRGAVLPAGYQIDLQLGALPLRVESYARWLAVAILVLLVAGSVLVVRRRRSGPKIETSVGRASTSQAKARNRRPLAPRRITSSPPNR